MEVILKPLFHRKQECIAIYFEENKLILSIVRKIRGARWSQTNKCWYFPYSTEIHESLINSLTSVSSVKNDELKRYEEKRDHIIQITKSSDCKSNKTLVNPYLACLSTENLAELERMMEMLRMKAYSGSTVRTYRQEFCALLQLLGKRNVKTLTADEVKRYVLYCINEKKLSENTIHSRLNALKFYFEQVLGYEKIFVEIPRPKKPNILPKVLGEKEIGRLFNALENKKHKAILFTAYSAGLRVSEVVNLKIRDIDSDRMQIFVQQAKGKKDRYVMLSPVVLDILRNYLKGCKPRPSVFLFEGSNKGEAISTRTAQQIFHDARRKAGIKKEVSFHSLRHSFATHLLEKGVDIKYIRDLLGHFSIQTTTRYLHVRRESLVNILSPLDDLYKSGEMDF